MQRISSIWRKRFIGTPLALLVVVAAGCGSGDGNAKVGTGGADADAMKASGLAVSQSPLSPRNQPFIAATGSSSIIAGGFQVEGNRRQALGDGAVYSYGSQSWELASDLGFTAAPYQISGVWTGNDLILIGGPCADTSTDSETALCPKSTSAEIVSFDPRTKTGKRLGVGIPDSSTSAPFLSRGIGYSDGHAVFQVQSGSHAGQMLLVDPTDGSTGWVASVPGADAVCPVGSQVLAFHTGQWDPAGGPVIPNPKANVQPLTTYALNVKSLSWDLKSSITKPAPEADDVQQIVCGAGDAAYIAYRGKLATSIEWLSADASDWKQLPGVEFGIFPSQVAIATVASQQVIWATSDGQLFALPEGAGSWASKEMPDVGPSVLIGSDPHVVLDNGYVTRAETPNLVGLDAGSLPPSK